MKEIIILEITDNSNLTDQQRMHIALEKEFGPKVWDRAPALMGPNSATAKEARNIVKQFNDRDQDQKFCALKSINNRKDSKDILLFININNIHKQKPMFPEKTVQTTLNIGENFSDIEEYQKQILFQHFTMTYVVARLYDEDELEWYKVISYREYDNEKTSKEEQERIIRLLLSKEVGKNFVTFEYHDKLNEIRRVFNKFNDNYTESQPQLEAITELIPATQDNVTHIAVFNKEDYPSATLTESNCPNSIIQKTVRVDFDRDSEITPKLEMFFFCAIKNDPCYPHGQSLKHKIDKTITIAKKQGYQIVDMRNWEPSRRHKPEKKKAYVLSDYVMILSPISNTTELMQEIINGGPNEPESNTRVTANYIRTVNYHDFIYDTEEDRARILSGMLNVNTPIYLESPEGNRLVSSCGTTWLSHSRQTIEFIIEKLDTDCGYVLYEIEYQEHYNEDENPQAKPEYSKSEERNIMLTREEHEAFLVMLDKFNERFDPGVKMWTRG